MDGGKQPLVYKCKVVFQRYLKSIFATDLIDNPSTVHDQTKV
jgi:hypothetical protein